MEELMRIDTILLQPDAVIPNNQHLPVIVYRQAISLTRDLAAQFEKEFANNGWVGSWRNGIYTYHHYHTRAHEVLGIAKGHATIVLGGATGSVVNVAAGDCLVLPAGTGHCRLDASEDFLVVGAYPPNQQADMNTEAASEADFTAIRACPLPDSDPIDSGMGNLRKIWHAV
jgi:uncharacterized protein YjlB